MRAMLALAVALAVAQPFAIAAQEDGDPISLGTYRVVHSDILGEDRILQVYLPRGYDESAVAYPVMYLLYSDLVELYFAQAVHDLSVLTLDRMPPVILVGVANTQRYRDLLPWPSADGHGGNADRFLQFVERELIPFVESEYRTEDFRILVGPQAGAVFGAYALLTSPATFDAFVLNDPCVSDREGQALCPEIPQLARAPEGVGKYLSITTLERDLARSGQALERLRDALERATGNGFRWRIEIREGVEFIPPVGLRVALTDLFSAYPFPSDREVTGLADVLSHYERLSSLYGFTVHAPDFVLARASDQLADAGRLEAALTILEHLADLYPASMNGLWRLANVHREMGDTAQAIAYYERCLRRDPNMVVAREWLERLRR